MLEQNLASSQAFGSLRYELTSPWALMKPHPVTFQVKDATLFYKGIYFWVDAGSAHAFPDVCDAASHTGQENSAVWGHQLGQGPLDPNTLVCISSFSSRELHTWPWGLQLGRDGGIFLGFLALGHLPCLTCTWSSWCFHTEFSLPICFRLPQIFIKWTTKTQFKNWHPSPVTTSKSRKIEKLDPEEPA